MTSITTELIEVEIERKSLLKHPFYQMWSHGELNLDQLSGYAKEYFQLVKVVPDMAGNIGLQANNSDAKQIIAEHQKEEAGHIELWVRFASALGIPRYVLTNFTGSEKTDEAVSTLVNLTKSSASFEEGVSVMYAYEWELPKISRSKIDGLRKFYGLASTDATLYFETHEEADIRHAATWRRFLSDANESRRLSMLQAAISSIDAQNTLLDSVMESYVN
jgi:pyrroloquinoline-quinone synthase